jgi:hypothetical protein
MESLHEQDRTYVKELKILCKYKALLMKYLLQLTTHLDQSLDRT